MPLSTPIAEALPAGYVPAPDELAGRVILITGATGGLGREAARAIAGSGAEVVLVGRNLRRLAALHDQIEEDGRGRATLCPMNLAGSMPEDYEECAARIESEYGRLDGLLHGAAVLGGLTALSRYPLERWAEVLQVNLNACFLLTRACLPLLARARDPVIAFIGDGRAQRGTAYWGAYAVSKAAVDTLSRILSDELECHTHTRVLRLDPGPMRTALRALAYPAEAREHASAAVDRAPALVFLFGPRSRGLGSGAFDLRPTARTGS